MLDKIGTAILVAIGTATSLGVLAWFTVLPAIGLLYMSGYLN